MYEPIGWKANDNGVGYVLKKYVGFDQSNVSIKRYFARFEDMPSRADLAYEMLRVATLTKPTGIIFQHFYDPDFWYVVEDEEGIYPFFAGLQYLVAGAAENVTFDGSNWGLSIKRQDQSLAPYPNENIPDNLQDALIYGINLACGLYNDYLPQQQGNYIPKRHKARNSQTLLLACQD